MLPTTMQAVRAVLTADPSVNPPERNRLLSLMRQGPEALAIQTATPTVSRFVRRAEAAERFGVSLRTIDKIARQGTLKKHVLPGRKRASGFLASDVETLLTGKGAA